MKHILLLAFDGFVFWMALRAAVGTAYIVLGALEPAFSWMLDPFIEWAWKTFRISLWGHTTSLDGLFNRMRRDVGTVQAWGWTRGKWGIGVVRLTK